MRLYKQERDGCVVTSVAMLINETPDATFHIIDKPMTAQQRRPFPEPWDDCPLVPSMHEICDRLLKQKSIALVPFERNPKVTPHPDCPEYPVWENPEQKFEAQLSYGKGLIEGTVGEKGHMVAWDGKVVYDPRGYCYSMNVASKFNFVPRRFWLAVCLK